VEKRTIFFPFDFFLGPGIGCLDTSATPLLTGASMVGTAALDGLPQVGTGGGWPFLDGGEDPRAGKFDSELVVKAGKAPPD